MVCLKEFIKGINLYDFERREEGGDFAVLHDLQTASDSKQYN
jgi:hypothetical protein